jgi:hypothetical protein
VGAVCGSAAESFAGCGESALVRRANSTGDDAATCDPLVVVACIASRDVADGVDAGVDAASTPRWSATAGLDDVRDGVLRGAVDERRKGMTVAAGAPSACCAAPGGSAVGRGVGDAASGRPTGARGVSAGTDSTACAGTRRVAAPDRTAGARACAEPTMRRSG